MIRNKYMNRFIFYLSKVQLRNYKLILNKPDFLEILSYTFKDKQDNDLPDIYNKIASHKIANEVMLCMSYNWINVLDFFYQSKTYIPQMKSVCEIAHLLTKVDTGVLEIIKYCKTTPYKGKSIYSSRLYEDKPVTLGEYFCRKLLDRVDIIQYNFSWFAFYYIIMHWIDIEGLSKIKRILSCINLSEHQYNNIFCLK